MSSDPGASSGCTAVVTLLRDKQLFVANAGDSRCVVSRGGRAIEMSIGMCSIIEILMKTKIFDILSRSQTRRS